MFKKLNNIDTAFQNMRRFNIAFLIMATLLCGYIIWKSFEMVARERDRIYILSNGKVLSALADSRRENLPVELRDHIASFHRYFFTLDPDEKVIQENMAKAFNLADISAKKVYDNLREQGFYANIISANISIRLEVDSISLDLTSMPYSFTCYATQDIIRSTSTVKRRLETKGQIRTVTKSDNNPQGFLIQRWETILNEDLPK
jgi:conjugative transposon TraK protein